MPLVSGIEARVAWRYLYGSPRDRRLWWAVALAVAVALAGAGLMTAAGGDSGVGAALVVVGSLATVLAVLLAVFSVFTSVSVLGIAIGVAALTVVLAVTTGFQDEFRARVLTGRAHLTVTSSLGSFGGYEDVMAKSVAVDPDIVGAEPFVYAEMLVTRGKGSMSGVELKGIDLARVGSVFDLAGQVTAGSLAALGAPRAPGAPPPLIVGDELAHTIKAKLGDRVTVVMPLSTADLDSGAPPSAPRTRVFEIVGIFDSGFEEYDRRFMYATLHDTQALLGGGDQAFGIELRVRDPDRAAEIGKAIETKLGGEYVAQNWLEMNANLFSALKIQKLVLVIILTLIIAVAAFNMVSALTMMVTDKTREIAILKSMGATSRSVAQIFVSVGLAIGVVGTSAGIAVGLIICRVVGVYGYRLDSRIYMIDRLPLVVRPAEVLAVAVVTLVISVVATIAPASAASSLTPVDGLRYD